MFYDINVKTRENKDISLNTYKGKVLLIFNSATGCGFTPQYEAIEELYKKYKDKGLEILDFPCDQFGHQAPGSDDEIHNFCQAKYNTSVDEFKKIDVNGDNESKLFSYLKSAIGKDYIKGIKNKMAMKAISKMSNTYKMESDIIWNFTKFLVDKNGNVVFRLSPIETPYILESKIKELVGE
jgi:glutathione peroxidase